MRGSDPAHLRDAAAEFARFLSGGLVLPWSDGGDLRAGGFTEVLFELLTAYRATPVRRSTPYPAPTSPGRSISTSTLHNARV